MSGVGGSILLVDEYPAETPAGGSDGHGTLQAWLAVLEDHGLAQQHIGGCIRAGDGIDGEGSLPGKGQEKLCTQGCILIQLCLNSGEDLHPLLQCHGEVQGSLLLSYLLPFHNGLYALYSIACRQTVQGVLSPHHMAHNSAFFGSAISCGMPSADEDDLGVLPIKTGCPQHNLPAVVLLGVPGKRDLRRKKPEGDAIGGRPSYS